MGRASDERERRRRLAAGKSPPLLSVQPPRIPSGQLASAIVAILRRDPGRTWTPGELCIEVKAKKANVKKELCRLLLPGRDDSPPPVQRTGRGLYACHLGPQELVLLENPQPKVHALQLSWTVPVLPPFGGSPPRSRTHAHMHAHARAGQPSGFGLLHAQGGWVPVEGSKSWQLRRFHGKLSVTLQAFPTTGTLLASIDSSMNPLDGPALAHLRTWLEATFQAEGFSWSEPRIATVEINRDFQRVRLAGREAARFYLGRMGISGEHHLKLAQLEGALVQIYNKERLGVMRQEVRLNPRDLDLPNLQALVTSMFYGPLPPQAQANPVAPEPEGGYS